jgi:hypothetical protein
MLKRRNVKLELEWQKEIDSVVGAAVCLVVMTEFRMELWE